MSTETKIIEAKGCVLNKRVDVFLCEQLQDISRSQVLAMIKSGAIRRRDGVKIKPSKMVLGNEEFEVDPILRKTTCLVAQDLPLDILYSDDHLAIINKAAGMVVHPGAGVVDNTLCNALLHHFPSMATGDDERPGIVHRLDKNTTGVMVVAKTQSMLRALGDMFKARNVEKIYRAFCWGEFNEIFMELRTGHVRHPFNRLRFFTGVCAPRNPTTNVRFAHTSIEVLQSSGGFSEIKATLHTGRTHQIRAHLADISHPLLGDDLYGGRRDAPKDMSDELRDSLYSLNGQALHAESIAFLHPATGEPIEIVAPLPKKLEHLKKVMSTLHS